MLKHGVFVGTPILDVLWFRNGEPLCVSDRLSLLMDSPPQYSLVIKECNVDDEAEYAVTAVNSEGKIYNAITVKVIEEEDM